jgi:hypothetical protein
VSKDFAIGWLTHWQAAGKVTEYVILRSPVSGGTTKNLEILRYAQDDRVAVFSRSLF